MNNLRVGSPRRDSAATDELGDEGVVLAINPLRQEASAPCAHPSLVNVRASGRRQESEALALLTLPCWLALAGTGNADTVEPASDAGSSSMGVGSALSALASTVRVWYEAGGRVARAVEVDRAGVQQLN